MVHADDSLRASLHVAPTLDVYESSARSTNDFEPVYDERISRAPETLVTTNTLSNGRSYAQVTSNGAVQAREPHVAVETNLTPVEPNGNKAPKAIAPKREKSATALPGTKPPKVGVNIEWIQKGVGWDCREVYYVGKQRHRRHLGHIGRQRWEDMQQQFQGTELERVLSEWIEERRAEKSLSVQNEKAAE